ncbi:MAG: VWA domain-containing protein [Candidatus Dormiibacterota bacterium]
MRGSDVVGGVVLRITSALRHAGVPVSTGEAIDAARALEIMNAGHRGEVRAALRATLIKRQDDVDTFERIFDALMATVVNDAATEVMLPAGPASTTSSVSPTIGETASTSLLEELAAALRDDDTDALRALAPRAVDQLAGFGSGSQDSERALLYRVLRGLDLARILQRALREGAAVTDDSAIAAALGPAEIAARVDEFRRLLAQEVRRRLDRRSLRDGRGIPRSSANLEDVPILGASPSDIAALQRALRPLARKLAVRGARRRRFTRRGRLDVRRTIRRSLSTGGVPVQPLWRRPRTTRPELVVLCDVSGSVAEFARFTLALMSAMSAEFSALRCFAFVDGVDEVTQIVADAQGALMPGHVLARTDVVWDDGHSDYGRVWSVFATRFSSALTPRSSLVITGDARSNYRAANAAGLAAMARAVREVHWLNPERREHWDTGDSVMALYARSCDSVHEVRTLRQLESAALDVATGTWASSVHSQRA